MYDPFNRRRKGGCSQTSHFHCPMGNLTGKHGALRVGKEMDIHSFYDENLQLSGLYSGTQHCTSIHIYIASNDIYILHIYYIHIYTYIYVYYIHISSYYMVCTM